MGREGSMISTFWLRQLFTAANFEENFFVIGRANIAKEAYSRTWLNLRCFEICDESWIEVLVDCVLEMLQCGIRRFLIQN